MRSKALSQTSPGESFGAAARGFTLVELLVVIGLLAALALLLLPTLAATKTQDKSAVCMSNLRQVYVGMMIYATDNNDTLHNLGGGNTVNGGKWTVNPDSTTLLSPTDGSAYWGVAYTTYSRTPRELFRCPSARIVDEWREDGRFYSGEFYLTSTYGLNQYLTRSYSSSALLKVTDIENPTTLIMTHDSAEQRLEGSLDSLALFPGDTRILVQWIGANAPSAYGGLSATYYGGYHFEDEWFRHDKRCNTLWLSGQVLKVPFTGHASGIDYRYYTGDKPLAPLPGN